MADTVITKDNAAQILVALMNENFQRGMTLEQSVDRALSTTGIRLSPETRLRILRDAEAAINAQLAGRNGKVEIVSDTKEYAKVTGQSVEQVEQKFTSRKA